MSKLGSWDARGSESSGNYGVGGSGRLRDGELDYWTGGVVELAIWRAGWLGNCAVQLGMLGSLEDYGVGQSGLHCGLGPWS